MIMTAEHKLLGDGNHAVAIAGLRVWLHKSASDTDQWIADGIDIAFATAGATRDDAMRAFLAGMCLTIVEHVKRFNSIEKLVSRRAPDEVFSAWIREIELQKVEMRTASFNVPQDEIADSSAMQFIPRNVFIFEPQAACA